MALRSDLVRADAKVLRRRGELQITLHVVGHRRPRARRTLARHGGNSDRDQRPVNDSSHVTPFLLRAEKPRTSGARLAINALGTPRAID
jgi:hypothetical protein